MFGVPGDFNLRFLVSGYATTRSCVLSELTNRTTLKTFRQSSGSETGMLYVLSGPLESQHISLRPSNELNAAYAADGYARVNEHSIGALITTYAPVHSTSKRFILNSLLDSESES
jgi:thiamine pyrophosphate-dependent acetolactate synthase large subunit-like protein